MSNNQFIPFNRNFRADISKTPRLTQLSLRSYLTCRSKRSALKPDSTTPTSSKFKGGARVPLKDVKNMRETPKTFEKFGTSRKRSSTALSQNDSLDFYEDVENECDSLQKRRCDQSFFDHGDDKEIPTSARSLHRAHSLGSLDVSPQSPDYLAHYSLLTIDKPRYSQHTAYGSISAQTISELLVSLTSEQFCRKFFLVDCRYPFEYKGGHIKNAVNIFDLNQVESTFYPPDPDKFQEINSKIPIFYCEFSQKRGPSIALELRRLDRVRNEHDYPKVDYKEIYVIDQGYQNFYAEKKCANLCEPNGYVPMLHKEFAENLKQYHSHIHEHSLAKMRKQPMFGTVTNKEESSPKITNFFASHQVCSSESSTDWETELEAHSTLFDLRYLTVEDVSDESD